MRYWTDWVSVPHGEPVPGAARSVPGRIIAVLEHRHVQGQGTTGLLCVFEAG